MPSPSYYFTIFKKLQVLGHVPAGTHHGVGVGEFNLTKPAAVFGSTSKGSPLASSNLPADSPLWVVLNSKATGIPGGQPVLVGSVPWPTMPLFETPAWLEFQVTASAPKLVSVLGDWIQGGKTNDIPTEVLTQVPPKIKRASGPINLFVCNMPGDDGTQPIPANFWDTALIFLLDPQTGAVANPASLAPSQEFYIAAIVGNRGGGAGRYLAGSAPKVECEAWVMVWNTGFSPAVKLPALSNLDITSKQGVYEVYYLKSGAYEVAGFRLPVQTVFDGLVKAIEDADVDLGGLTPAQWIHAKNAHLCARVMVRHVDQGWPFPNETSLDTRRVGQKNLAPFDLDTAADQPDPNIEWTHFMIGDVLRCAAPNSGGGTHRISVVNHAQQLPLELYVAIPRRSFVRVVDRRRMRGFEVVDGAPNAPFPDAVVLRCVSSTNSIPVAALGDRRFMAASLGIRYRPTQLQPGLSGDISVVQRTAATLLQPAQKTYKLQERVVGGFTLRIAVH